MTAAQIISPPEPTVSDPAEDRDLVHLKRLLLTDDRRDIAAIRAELFRLDKRLGTDDRFCRAVADQLVAALKTAEIENHRGLATVMAPLVVSGIRREIVESRDAMVEALYPITGRLVAAAVGAAMKQLSEDINRKLEASLSPRQLQLRVKALITRRPLSDLVLAETARGRLERLILIDRATGAVLGATDADGKGEPEPDATLSLLGGLVSAIVQFAGHALADTQGELRQLDFGGQMVLLRASPLFILAAITAAGTPNPQLSGAVDGAFLGFLERLRDDTTENESAALAELHESVAQGSTSGPKASSVSPLKVVGVLFALALAFGAWHYWASVQQRRGEERVLAAIEQSSQWSNYPLDLSFDRENKTIRARGVLPTQTEATALRTQVTKAFPLWAFAPKIAVISETPLAHATETALKESAAALEAQAARAADLEKTLRQLVQNADISRSKIDVLNAVQGRQAAQAANLAATLEAQKAQVADLEKALRKLAQNSDTARSAIQALTAIQGRDGARATGLETSLKQQTDHVGELEKALSQMAQDAAAIRTEIQALTLMQSRQTAHGANLDTTLLATTKTLDDLRTQMTLDAQAADKKLQSLTALQNSASETTQQKIDQLVARFDTPLNRLEAMVRKTAVFFDAGAMYRNPEAVAQELGLLAKALGEAPDARLRVVGYGDGSGTAKGNLEAARARATHVVADLEKLGVDPSRLRVLTTRSPYPIVDELASAANRRVVFELAFTEE